MAISSYQDFYDKTQNAYFFPFSKASVTTTSTSTRSAWTTAPLAGAAPGGTARTCSATTTGALLQNPQLVTRTATLYLAELCLYAETNAFTCAMLIDRLADISGLNGTTIGVQSASIPVGSLPARIGSNYGLIRAAMEVYTALGATPTTATMDYLDQSGASSTAQTFTIPANLAATTFIPMVMADGDTGVQGCSNISLAGSTGSVGNFGATLYTPLTTFLPTNNAAMQAFQGSQPGSNMVLDGMTPIEIADDACLQLLVYSNTTSSGPIRGYLKLIEV